MAKTSSKNYFTKETEDYIVKFNNSTDPEERHRIFTEHLYFPFYKLAECIIHTFKFYNTDVDCLEDLKCDIIRTIYEDKIAKFNPNLGFKAYSYFGTVVKRWLVAYNKKNYKLKTKTVSLDPGVYSDTLPEDDIPSLETGDILHLSEFMDMWVTETYQDLEILFPDELERKIADAVLTLFKTRQSISVFNKKALYIYLKEITGSKTMYVTKTVAKLKELFYTRLRELQDQGLIADTSS